MSKYWSVKYLLISKKLAPLFELFSFCSFSKNSVFGVILGGFPGEWPQNISGDKIAFATQQLYKKLDFAVLWFRRRRVYKILEGKKGKKSHRG